MIIKFLGIIDLVLGISFWLFGVFGIFENVVLLFGIILLCKGLVFSLSGNRVSFVDFIFALIVLIGTAIDLPIWMVVLISIFLLQKGIFSMLG